MRTRKPPPSLVSMWMLDVFCCALGCVTLLWLLNTRLAGDERAKAATALEDLTSTRQTLLSTRDSADATHKALNAEIDLLKAKLVATTAENVALTSKLAIATTDLASTAARLATTEADAIKVQAELIRKQQDAKELSVQLATSTQAQSELDKLLRQREAESAALMAKTKTADEKLHDLDAKYLALSQENAKATANLATMKRTGDALSQAQSTIRELQKKIDDTNATIVDLQGDKAKLADKVDKLRIDSDARFAGISMTGRRVVFLVDASGSMKLLDDKTPAPKKWPTVIETLTKVMRSLPELEKFQIITFSKTARHLYATQEWINYQGEATLKDVSEKLLAIQPAGDTNLYEAFDLAFRRKIDGLDTIYLLSDGLPTSGPGLTPEQDRTLTEAQRSEILVKEMKVALRSRWNPAEGRRVKINSIGFFFESPEVGAFLWSLSRDNDGSFVGMNRP